MTAPASTANYISPDDMAAAIRHIPDLHQRVTDDDTVAIFFQYLYWVGLRFAEGRSFHVDNYDLGSNTIYLKNRKHHRNANQRLTVPSQFRADWADAVLRYEAEGMMTPFAAIKYRTFATWLRRLGAMCKIKAWQVSQDEIGEKTLSHGFRKSIAKDMYHGTRTGGKRATLNMIQTKLGHSDIATTAEYLKLTHEAEADFWAGGGEGEGEA